MRLLAILSAALCGVAGAAAAVDLSEAPGDTAVQVVDVSYDASVERLGAKGFRVVRLVPFNVEPKLVRFDTYTVNAFDPQGSEVLLTISMTDGRVVKGEYVHATDR